MSYALCPMPDPRTLNPGYLLEVSIKGIDPRNRLQAQPTRVLTVTGPTTFTLQGNVPRKISGVPLPSLLGRSKVAQTPNPKLQLQTQHPTPHKPRERQVARSGEGMKQAWT
jgi:hypothetical protein